MRRAGVRRQFGFAVLLAAATSSLSAAEDLLPDPRSTARNTHFEVVGDDMLSAQYVAKVGEILAERFLQILPAPNRLVQPVLVDLVPVPRFEWDSFFVTRIYPSGQVEVSIRWGEKISRGTLERALAQGYLTHMATLYTQGAVTVPLWLELAVQHLARTETLGAHARFLAARVTDERPMRLEAILSAARGEGVDEDLAPDAYWLLMFLEDEGRGDAQLRNFLIRLFRGEAPLVAMNAAFGGQLHSASEAEMWWLVGLNELVRSPASPLLSMDEAAGRLGELSRFTFRVAEDEVRLFPEDLWLHYESTALQNELRHRSRVMSLESNSFHPYYHNALLSLNRVFQAVLAANEGEYRKGLVEFRHDQRVGDELVEDTASVLDDLQGELAE